MAEDEEKKLETMVYWARCAMGIALGAVLAALWRSNIGGLLTAASISILAYLASYYIFTAALGNHRVEMLGGKSKLYTIGIGIFFMSVVFSWILLYSLFFYAG